jgi:hypothetical protein
MQTTDLIERLAKDLRPTPLHAAARRLGIGTGAGAVIALGIMWAFFGLRGDLADAVFTSSFWMKWAFAFAVSGAAFFLCTRLARPDGAAGLLPIGALLPIGVLGAMATFELIEAPGGERRSIWLGESAAQCPWSIALLAVPFLIGILWAFRRFAPTRPRLAGFSAGLLAGAAAAVVYALHCPETGVAFVATWYTAGILLPALLGLIIGSRILRW